MTAHELRDLREGILIELYRLAASNSPRTAEQLQKILRDVVPCTVGEVNAALLRRRLHGP